MDFRAGLGYDAHRLEAGVKLTLGGVVIPYAKGLMGHSDADVLTHAVIDAVLGALGRGDIGRLFPDTDDKYKGASSVSMLAEVGAMLRADGYRVSNVDAVIIAQSPKLAPYTDEMERNIAGALSAGVSSVNVKATTEEGMGFTGDGSGMAAKAVCVITK